MSDTDTNNIFNKTNKIHISVILDNVRSMVNVGAIFRNADAFFIEKIYLCGITPQPPHREINKTALGATKTVEWKFYPDIKDIINKLKTIGYKIIAVEQNSNSKLLQKFEIDISGKYALIFGNEIEGVQQEVLDTIDDSVEIPQLGFKKSLNVSVCSGIVLWEFYKRYISK